MKSKPLPVFVTSVFLSALCNYGCAGSETSTNQPVASETIVPEAKPVATEAKVDAHERAAGQPQKPPADEPKQDATAPATQGAPPSWLSKPQEPYEAGELLEV